jgi:hypothetical protein
MLAGNALSSINMIKILSLLAFIVFQINSSFCQAPQNYIKGQVVGVAQQPLSAATVLLVDRENLVVTKNVADSSGHFQLSYNFKGSYALVVSYTGYSTYKSETFVLANKDFGTVQLNEIRSALDEVVVTQARQNLVELDGGTIVYNVSKSITAQGASALEALKNAPGIYIDNDNAISLNGRGGALILLDGKQTYLSGKEIIDLLKSMPSSGIKSIEIINSPTAKYDAAGSAGIINIKTNKSNIKGFNGMLTSGISYGVSLKQNSDLSFNYRRNKYNIYGSYNHLVGHYNYVYGSDRIQLSKAYNSFTDDTDKRKNMGTRIGVDYDINKKNTIGLLLTGNFVFGGGITRTKTDVSGQSSPVIEQTLDAVNDYYYQQTERYNLNLNYKYEDAAGSIINIDVDYGSFKKNNKNLQSNIYTNNQNTILNQNLYRSFNGIDINLKAFKVDYATDLWKGKLETGAKYSDIRAGNAAQFFHVIANKDSMDQRRSNVFDFTEQISSGYINYKKSFGKWVLQAGLRLENSPSDGSLYFKMNGTDSTENIRRNYTNLFPSFSASVKPIENHSFSIGYARRIDRPAYQDLNPFVYLLDELSFWQGNPFLQPQLTHRLSLQYVYKSSTVISLAFSRADQYSTRITDTVESQKIVFVPRNLGIQENASLTLTQNITPARWWNITFNGILYHLRNKIAFDQHRNFNLKQLAGRMSMQQIFKLPYKMTAEVSGYYVTKRLSGANARSRENSGIDLGLQKNFWYNKGTIRLAVTDIYKGSKSNSEQSYDGFYLRNYGYYETRMVRLNFTFKFADSSIKGPRSRASALENENGRIK